MYSGYPPDQPVANDAPYRPTNVYAGTKVLNEVLVEEYSRVHGLETIGTRFTLLVGPAEYGGGGFTGTVWRELIEKPVCGLPARVPYADDSPSWLWIDDAARSLVLAARVGATKSRAFNVSSDVRSVREATEIVRRLIPGADVTLEPGVGHLSRSLDTTAIEQELGFRIEWRLEDQFWAMVERARSNLAG